MTTSRSVLKDVVNELAREDVELEFTDTSPQELQRLLATGERDVRLLLHPLPWRSTGAAIVQRPLAGRRRLRLSLQL